jgi:hypothetical protein
LRPRRQQKRAGSKPDISMCDELLAIDDTELHVSILREIATTGEP